MRTKTASINQDTSNTAERVSYLVYLSKSKNPKMIKMTITFIELTSLRTSRKPTKITP